MAVNFLEKFGLPKDRLKLVSGIGNFDVIYVEFHESKKEYDTTVEGVIRKKKIKIVYLNVKMATGDIMKYYSPNAPIIDAAEQMLKEYGNSDGTLREAVHIEEVKEGKSDKNRPYLYFT